MFFKENSNVEQFLEKLRISFLHAKSLSYKWCDKNFPIQSMLLSKTQSFSLSINCLKIDVPIT